MKNMMLVILICGVFVAQSAAAACQECDNIPGGKYPGIKCAPVSISDEGHTECVVDIHPDDGVSCVFSGDRCDWEAPDIPDPNGECDGTHVGRLNPNEEPEQIVTPNGQFKPGWAPRDRQYIAVEG